ncbi:MAG: glycosyltransferase [Holosporaceae bacterium]|nr:glycosyltransferase [Holosporaceae bacterium]
MNTPKITVVTVTRNLIKNGREKHFRQCLESVRSQTYKNIEHLIIDGASADGTLDLIKEYANKKQISYISEPDSGIYNAMNKGVLKATGKYVAFLNSDDFWHDPRGVEESVGALEKNAADFSYADALFLRKDGKKKRLIAKIGAFFTRMPFCHQTMFTKTEVLRENLFNEKYKSAGDYDLILRLCMKKCKPIFVESVFTTYRDGGFSVTDSKLSIAEVLDITRNLFSELLPNLTIDDCKQMYFENIVREDLLEIMKSVVCPGICDRINRLKIKRTKCGIAISGIRYLKNMRFTDRIKMLFSTRG